MSEELVDLATDSVRGGVHLFSGKALSFLVLLIGSIVIARLLGPENYGVYSLALVVPGILIALVDIGVRHSLTRYLAKYKGQGRSDFAASFLLIGLLFQVGLGLTASLAGILFADYFAALLNRPGMQPFIRLASAVIFFHLLFLTLNSIFIGLNRMEGSAGLLHTQALTKSTIAPVLVILGFGVYGAIIGHILGSVIAVLVGLGIFLPIYSKYSNDPNRPARSIVGENVKTILRYSGPLYLASLVVMLQGYSQTILLAQFVNDSVIGNFAVAVTLALSLGLLSYPFTSLFPAFSKMSPKTSDLNSLFRLSVRYSAMAVVPVAVALSLLSEHLVRFVYGHQYQLAAQILSIYALIYALAGFGSAVLTNMLRGLDQTGSVLKMGIIGFLSFIPLGLVGTISFGVMGLVAGFLVSQAFAVMYGLAEAKELGARVDLKGSASIYVSAFFSAISLYAFLAFSPLADIMNLLGGILLYAVVYATILPLTGAIKPNDFRNFQVSLQQNRLIWPLVKLSISYQQKILNIWNKQPHY